MSQKSTSGFEHLSISFELNHIYLVLSLFAAITFASSSY